MKTSIEIPAVVESYFAASNADDVDALVRCFTPDAAVSDENETHRGADAIKAWAVNVRKKYQFKSEILKAEGNSPRTVVTAKVSGTFPGSPVNLDFKFACDQGRISSLEIG
jgi:ketosteroid isomerase-like protein